MVSPIERIKVADVLKEPPVVMRVACVQLNSGIEVRSNLETIERQLKLAQTANVDVVLLPENFAQMPLSSRERHCELWLPSHPDAEAPIQRFLNDAAARYKLTIIAGSVPIKQQSQQSKPFARCMVINAEGTIVGHYDKLHLFDVDTGQLTYRESDDFEIGRLDQLGSTPAQNLVNVHSADASCLFGLTICYDLRFPEIYRHLLSEGARVFTVPAAFTYETGMQHWQVLLRARAIENQCYVVAAGQCGEHKTSNPERPRRTWGHSMVIDPRGEVIASLKHAEGLLIADIDLTKQDRARELFPVIGHRRM